ncbi:MAG: hypothetical protein K8S97_05275 [Anaerolineae bacterium]|nr:hypothetical protein [Anaerolineae bacterium]
MSRRLPLIVLLLCALTALATIPAVVPGHAQTDPTAQINAALTDLSTRAGIPLTLNDLSTWRWSGANYPDTSLDCPQPGVGYLQVVTPGYRIEFTYSGATFDYRASADGSILFLCAGPATVPGAQPAAAPTNTPAAAQIIATAAPAGRAVCPGAMDTQLNVGDEARVRPAGLPVNVRASASAASTQVTQLAPGDTFIIIGGPVCAENLVWWNIRVGAFTGWAGEGANGLYWIEPTGNVVAQPTPTSQPVAAQPTPAAPTINEDAVVYTLPEGNAPAISSSTTAQLGRQFEFPIAEPVTSLAWSPDGQTLAVTGQHGLRLYTLALFRNPPRVFQVPNGPTNAVAFSPDGSLIVTGHQDAIVRVWDINTGGLRALLRGHLHSVWTVAFSPDGSLIASGDGNLAGGTDSTVRVWDVSGRVEVATLVGHTGAVTALAFSPDGSLLVSGGMDGTVRFWDVASGNPGTLLTNHTDAVRAVAFSPDGTWLASAGDDAQIHLWEIASSTLRTLEGHGSATSTFAFSPDGSLLFTGGGAVAGADDPVFVRVWDLATGQIIASLPAYDTSPDSRVTGLTFAPTGINIAVAHTQEDQGFVRVWEVLP